MPIICLNVVMIGHSLLGSEHEHIVNLINNSGQEIKDHITRSDIVNMYGRIDNCLSEHFIQEEQIMASSKYPYYGPPSFRA